MFGWFPWFSYATLNINQKKETTFENAIKSKLLLKDGCCEVGIPNRNHMKRMEMKLLGNAPLDTDKSSAINSSAFHGPISAVMCGWTICNGSGISGKGTNRGIKVSDILLSSNKKNTAIRILKTFFNKKFSGKD